MAERVLIVDDDPVARRLVENIVSRAGFEPVTAEGGDAALALLTSGERIDCVILDLVMPERSEMLDQIIIQRDSKQMSVRGLEIYDEQPFEVINVVEETCDLIFSTSVLEHVMKPREVVEKMVAALRTLVWRKTNRVSRIVKYAFSNFLTREFRHFFNLKR